MAMCNLFRQLSKDTGNFLMFDQYSDDLTRCFVQHDSYDIIPSKFITLDIDYSRLSRDVLQSEDMNEAIPTFFQNFYENGCAWLKSSSVTGDDKKVKWDVAKWNPSISNNIFWNTLIQYGLLHVSKYDKYWSGTKLSGDLQSFDVIDEIRYIGNIDIHSYEEKDGIGYSEIYCYIPNNAARTLYKIVDLLPQSSPAAVSYSGDYCVGCSAETENILGVLPVGIQKGDPAVSPIYYYGRKYKFYGNEEESDTYDYVDEANMRDYNKYRKLSDMNVENFFKFNTIVVLYDIKVRDKQGNISTLYQDVPMGIYLTGKWDAETSKITNEVVKYSMCEDAYKSGTSYGLRICTRYMCTPNSTTIASVELDPADQYAGFSLAMDEMAKSQLKMDEMLSDVYSRTQDMKEAIMSFKNSKANCPYIRKIGNKHYWFINGRNTGVPANGNPGRDGRNGTILELVNKNGTYYWALDGEITNVRAEGLDGTPGLKGEKGEKGDPGVSPEISIKQAKGSQDWTWFINGEDTKVQAKANNGKDGKDGKDGITPNIVQANDGNKYWYFNGITTGVQAEGRDGLSIFALTSVVPKQDVFESDGKIMLHNTTSDRWKEHDIILYTGPNISDGYKMRTYDLYKIQGFNNAFGAWEVQLLGNVAGSVDGGVTEFSAEKNGATTRFNIKSADQAQTFDVTNKTNIVSHSTYQRKYNHLCDTIYCCGRPKHHNESLLEIPYNVHFIRTEDKKWNVAISVDSKYSGLRGTIVSKRSQIFIKNDKYKASDLMIKDGNSYVDYEGSLDEIVGKKIKQMYVEKDNIIQLAYLQFDSNSTNPIPQTYKDFNYNTVIQPGLNTKCDITSTVSLKLSDQPTQYVIWKDLSQSEKQALAYSYKISRHIGKVHAYIDLYEVYSKSNEISHEAINTSICKLNDNITIANPCLIQSRGILSYSKFNDRWEVESTYHPVDVAKFNKTVKGFIHENHNPSNIKNIFDLMSAYSPDDLMVYKRSKLYRGLCFDKYLWKKNKITHPFKYGSKDSKFTPNAYIFYHWIKHSPLAKVDRYNNVLWKWFVMNEFADLILKYPGNTRKGELPFITSDKPRSSNGAPLRYSYTGAANTTRDKQLFRTRYVYVACGSPNSKKDIYKISLKWIKNRQYNPEQDMMSIDRLTPESSTEPTRYIRYNGEFNPESNGDNNSRYSATMLPVRGVLNWVCDINISYVDNTPVISYDIRRENHELNRDYYAVLTCEYVKSMDELSTDNIIYPLMTLDSFNSVDINDIQSENTMCQVLSATGDIIDMKYKPFVPAMYSVISQFVGRNQVFKSLVPLPPKVNKLSRDSNKERTIDDNGYIYDIWGREVCWDNDGKLTYTIESTENSYNCMRKPLNRLIYARSRQDKAAYYPLVNISLQQLDPTTADLLKNAKKLEVNNGQISITDITQLKLGSDFPFDEKGQPLFTLRGDNVSVEQIDPSLYTPNPL